MKHWLPCLALSLVALTISAFDNLRPQVPEPFIHVDTFVDQTWKDEGILVTVEPSGPDLFEIAVEVQNHRMDHPLRRFVRELSGVEQASTVYRGSTVIESYRLSHTTPDLDGPADRMPDLVGRMVREGYHRVVDAQGLPIFYTLSDFEDRPEILNSRSLERLLNDYQGDALAFSQNLMTRSELVRKVFSEYPGVAVAELHVRLKLSREMDFNQCIMPVGSCIILEEDDPMAGLGNLGFADIDTAPVDPLATFLLTPSPAIAP